MDKKLTVYQFYVMWLSDRTGQTLKIYNNKKIKTPRIAPGIGLLRGCNTLQERLDVF